MINVKRTAIMFGSVVLLACLFGMLVDYWLFAPDGSMPLEVAGALIIGFTVPYSTSKWWLNIKGG